MDHHKLQEPHQKGFFESSFSNFFNSCQCVGGRKNNDEKSSMGSRKDLLKHQQMINDLDQYSSNSNNLDWVDLDDGPHAVTHDETYNYSQGIIHGKDEFETHEPIDFDYLKKLTGAADEEEQAEKSLHSGLSKSSKKITKSKKESTKDKTTEKGSKAKGKRNPWQPHEDAKLLELVDKHGQSWSLISSLMEGRTGKQIRDRYLNILRPNIKKGDWTPYEDQQILALYYQFGHKWSKIASYVPNRTEGQVKNRFYSHIKKKILVNDVTYDSNAYLSQGTPAQMSFNNGYQDYTPSHPSAPRQLSPIPDSIPPSQNISPSNSSQTPYNYANNAQPTFFHPADDMISYNAGSEPQYTANQQQVEGSPLSQGSTGTHSSHYNPNMVYNESDVDNVLGRIAANYYQQPGAASPINGGEDALSKMNKAEALNKRKQTLEYLLAQTMREMNTFTGK